MKRNFRPLLALAILIVSVISPVIIAIAANTPESTAENAKIIAPESTAKIGVEQETSKPAGTAKLKQTHAQTRAVTVTSAAVNTTVETTKPDTAWEPDETDVQAIAKVIYHEARGESSKAKQAAVAWCILNRVDSSISYFPDTILEVITQKNQVAWDENAPLMPNLVTLARDVLIRWHAEREGAEDVGRTLPAEYVYFVGDGRHNNFSIEWRSGIYWTWDYTDPYTAEAVW